MARDPFSSPPDRSSFNILLIHVAEHVELVTNMLAADQVFDVDGSEEIVSTIFWRFLLGNQDAPCNVLQSWMLLGYMYPKDIVAPSLACIWLNVHVGPQIIHEARIIDGNIDACLRIWSLAQMSGSDAPTLEHSTMLRLVKLLDVAKLKELRLDNIVLGIVVSILQMCGCVNHPQEQLMGELFLQKPSVKESAEVQHLCVCVCVCVCCLRVHSHCCQLSFSISSWSLV